MWFSAIFLCGFVVFGMLLLSSMTSSVNSFRDQKLIQRAEHMAEEIEKTHTGSQDQWWMQDEFLIPSADGRILQMYSLAGKTLKRKEVTQSQFPWPAVPDGRVGWGKSIKFNGERYRVYARTEPFHGALLRILVARTLMDNPDLLDRSALILIRFIPGMLLVSAFAGYLVSRRALRPVAQLTASARSITIGNLASRLPVGPVNDELARLAETCNEMLSRLEEAVQRITQFTADASHELRSPVAFIRIASEDALRIPGMPDEALAVLEKIISETAHSQELLEDMLLLARFDASVIALDFERIYISEIIESVISRMQVFALQKRQKIAIRLSEEELICLGNVQMTARLIRILVDNAIKYTPCGSTIEIDLTRVREAAVLSVTDNGPGIAERHLPHLFDRFYRVDPSRGEQKGNGLGLAIAKRIAEAHHAEITVRSEEGMGSTFEIRMPLVHCGEAEYLPPKPFLQTHLLPSEKCE